MSKILVSSLNEDQEVADFFMIRSRQLRSFRDRAGSFLVLRLGDKSGEIEAKLWDKAEQWYGQLKDEMVVRAAGHTQIYNGRLEMTISKLRPARDEEYVLDDFLPTSKRDRGAMQDELQSVIDGVKDSCLNGLLSLVFDAPMLAEFSAAPAAKVIHHAYLGGLIEHSLEVVRFCRTALQMYPAVDSDLLITGALLHDIGKIREYTFRRSIEFSDEGRLIGHIVLGEEYLVEKARQIPSFPEDLLLRLRHMMLSHHGRYDWQSPKRPKTLEACILHLADYFSGQVAMFAGAIEAAGDSGADWTAYNRHLERHLYVGNGSASSLLDDEPDPVRRLFEEPYQGY